MKYPRHALTLALGLALLPAVRAAATLYGLADDRQVSSAGSVSDANPMLAGYSGTIAINSVFVFQLPTLSAGKEFSNVSARFYHQGRTGTPAFNADLYGLGVSDAPAVSSADFYAGPLDTGAILLHDNLLTPASGAGGVTAASPDLTDYLNAAYANGANAGRHVFFRLSPDVAGLNNYTRYNLYSAETALGAFYKPSLTYDTADVAPNWRAVPIGGCGFVTGLIGDASGADLYARTDVAGLFKWSSASQSWTSITGALGGVSTRWRNTHGLHGTLSLAIDPSDTNNLYIVVGGNDSYNNNVNEAGAGIFHSPDKGATWTEITTGTLVPDFGINGNGDRASGERLAVDPNNPGILWFGSQSHGLIKGVKSGSSWSWTQLPASSLPFGTSGSGIRFVVCDKNGSSTLLYAGVVDTSGSAGGIYKSADGAVWTRMATLASPERASVASDGTLFVAGQGAVLKISRAGAVSTITPGSASDRYRGLAISPDGSVVCVAKAVSNTGEVWRSVDGGATWSGQGTTYFNDGKSKAASLPPQEPDGTLSKRFEWFANTSALWIHPANPQELWASDFYGVMRTLQADKIGATAIGSQPTWHRMLKNLEESVVFSVKNAPTGPRLLTGVADVGGFRHAADTTARPFAAGNGGTLGNIGNGKNVTSLDFSETSPDSWAFAWATDGGTYGSGGVSLDGGQTWMRFGQMGRARLVNSPAAGWETIDLGSYLAKQRAKGATTFTLVVAGAADWWEDTPSMSFDSRTAANPPRLVLNGSAERLPVADTWVSRTNSTTNNGADTRLVIRGNSSTDAYIYLKFDLSDIPSITSAQLKLHRQASTDTRTFEVGVHACANTTWIEGDGGTDNSPAGEMRWTNRPAPLSDTGGLAITGTPNYWAGGKSLRGGRIAVSSVDPAVLVWNSIGPSVSSPATFYSEDRGVTWTESTGAPNCQIMGLYTDGTRQEGSGQNLTADRVNGHFYIGRFGGTEHSIYRSTDEGRNWSLVGSVTNGGTYNARTTHLSAAPASPAYPAGGDLWLSDDSAYNNGSGGGLWRSTDGGVNWLKLGNLRRASQVAFGKQDPSVSTSGYTLYAHAENLSGIRGVYRSTDYGANWTMLAPLPSSMPIYSMTGDRQNHNRVFIGTGGMGVFEYGP